MSYNRKQQLGFFEDNTSNRITVRVKFDGATGAASYTTASDTAVDTTLRGDLSTKSAAELQALCTEAEKFALAESRAVYRNVTSGTNTSTLTIPLATVNKVAIVGGFGVITTSCGGTQSYSVGIPGNTGFILGAVQGTGLAIPSGATTAIWNSDYPYNSSAPTVSSAAAGKVYYAPDKLVSPGTPINLYVTAGTGGVLGSGDITFELFATAFGKETYGVTTGISTKRGSIGHDLGPISPKF